MGGCTEVAEKSCKDVTDLEPSLKCPCMVAVNSAQCPLGESEQDLEELRVRMALEMKKVHKDLAAITRCMGKTAACREQMAGPVSTSTGNCIACRMNYTGLSVLESYNSNGSDNFEPVLNWKRFSIPFPVMLCKQN